MNKYCNVFKFTEISLEFMKTKTCSNRVHHYILTELLDQKCQYYIKHLSFYKNFILGKMPNPFCSQQNLTI